MYRALSQGVKGESVKCGGGKTSELLCIKHTMYRALSQGVKGESVKCGGGKTSELLCNKPICNMIKGNESDVRK